MGPVVNSIGFDLNRIFNDLRIVAAVLVLIDAGALLRDALAKSNDQQLAGAIVLMMTAVIVLFNFLTDILLAVIDPRVRKGFFLWLFLLRNPFRKKTIAPHLRCSWSGPGSRKTGPPRSRWCFWSSSSSAAFSRASLTLMTQPQPAGIRITQTALSRFRNSVTVRSAPSSTRSNGIAAPVPISAG